MIESLLLPGNIGPSALVQSTTERTEDPSALRLGIVAAVTSRGIDVAVASGLVTAAHLDSYAPAVGDNCALMKTQDSWLAIGRVVGTATPTDFSGQGSGAGLTCLGGGGLAGGGATLASSTGAVVTVPRYGVTYFHPPGHWVALAFGYSWYSSVANDWLQVKLRDASTSTDLFTIEHVQAGNNFFGNFATQIAMVPPSFGGTGHSVFSTIQRISGTGTSRIDDSGTRRGYLLAIDIADQSVVPIV